MPLPKEPVPNRRMTGDELAEYSLHHLRERFANDCRFSAGISYGPVSFELTALFHLGLPVGDAVVSTFTKPEGVVVGQPPLDPAPALSEVVAFKLQAEVDNPNLARVAASLPITVTERTPPLPNELFPAVKEKVIEYNRDDYPVPPPAAETDLSEQMAEQWGVKATKPAVIPDPVPPVEEKPEPRKRKTPKGVRA